MAATGVLDAVVKILHTFALVLNDFDRPICPSQHPVLFRSNMNMKTISLNSGCLTASGSNSSS